MKLVGILWILLSVLSVVSAQEIGQTHDSIVKSRIAFYNVENLFDIFNDSLTNDDEFTPEGERHWNNKKFYQKLNNIYKVILGIGEWNPPAAIGLCEIENRFVLNKLVYETPLKNSGYKIIHFDSPDRRGIDVAFLYRPALFSPLRSYPIRINLHDDTAFKTRDILYIKGILGEADTVHFFVNHWPSRYGGYEDSKPKRMFVASVLRNKVDSLQKADGDPNIIIMGDFNDEPSDESIQSVLRAKTNSKELNNSDLFDMMVVLQKKADMGTNKYREDWSVIDQFIVSGNLLLEGNKLIVSPEGAQVYAPDFLLEDDRVHFGKQPFRTYEGFSYHGGFSDHLAIFLDLVQRR
jgi:hypothetical protein